MPLLVFSALTIFFSCTKTTSTTCNNGIKDAGEQEIDCGGTSCKPCLPAGTLTCTLGTTAYVGTSTGGQILGPSIRVYADDNQNRPLNFMFVPGALNQPINIASANFSYQGDPYTKQGGDTGTVYITALDTTRKIISGTFAFSASRFTGGISDAATNGIFTNIRYGNN